MAPTLYFAGRARTLDELTDAEVTLAVGMVNGDDRALLAALVRVKQVEGGVLELPG